MHPPWSTATSTMTARGFIARTMSSLTTTGARPPATSTAPINRSQSMTLRSIAPRLEASVMIRPRWIWSTQRRRSRFLSMSTTSASMPAAIHAAFQPTLPAPITTTFAGRTPGAPPISTPAAALVPLEEVGALLRRQPPGDLAHRCQQRAGRRRRAARSRRPARRAGGDERLGDLGIGGEVQVGEQRQVVAEEGELLLLGLLHLDDHLLGPRVLGASARSLPRRRRSRRR